MKICNFTYSSLLLIALLNASCNQAIPTEVVNNKSKDNRVVKVQPITAELKAIFRKNVQLPVKSNVDGAIESLPLSDVRIVQKGQIIVQLNNGASFKKLLESKHILKVLIDQTLENLPESLKNQVPKWNSFKMKLNPADLIPSLPSFDSENEKDHFTNQGLFYAYDELVAADKEMDNYFIVAPQDGQLHLNKINIGLELKKNQTIGTVKKYVTPYLEFSPPIKNSLIDTFDIILPTQGSIGMCTYKNGKLKSTFNIPTINTLKNGTTVILRKKS